MAVTINGTTGITAPEVVMDNGTADGGQVVLKSSGYDNWNLDNYSGTFRAYYNATEQVKVTSAGLFQMNSGYGSVATAYGCRAWVNFNGTGTVAIRASGNVTSITDNGTGDYTVNFTNAMPDANYTPVVSNGDATSADLINVNYGVNGVTETAPSASSFRLGAQQTGTAVRDQKYMHVAVFR